MDNGRVPYSKHPPANVGPNRHRNWLRCPVRTTWYPDILNHRLALDSEKIKKDIVEIVIYQLFI